LHCIKAWPLAVQKAVCCVALIARGNIDFIATTACFLVLISEIINVNISCENYGYMRSNAEKLPMKELILMKKAKQLCSSLISGMGCGKNYININKTTNVTRASF